MYENTAISEEDDIYREVINKACNDPMFLFGKKRMNRTIDRYGGEWLGYVRVYLLKDDDVDVTRGDDNMSPRLTKFVEKLSKIGNEEKMGKLSLLHVGIKSPDYKHFYAIVYGFLEGSSEERCESKWERFKDEFLNPVEDDTGISECTTAVFASYSD